MTQLTLSLVVALVSYFAAFGNSLFILVTRDGHPIPIQLMSIDRDHVEVLIPETGHHDLPKEECLALLRPEPRPLPDTDAQLHLRDGQVFIGHLDPALSSDDSIHWVHPWIGELHVPLDQVDLMKLAAGSGTREDDGYDQVVLHNGDVLRGFITSVGDVLEIEIERQAGTETTRVPWPRVSSIDLFGPPVPLEMPRIWFMDGTIASFKEINLGQDSWMTFADHTFLVKDEEVEPAAQPMREVHSIAMGGTLIHPLLVGVPGMPGIETPPTRPQAPRPRVTDPTAVLGLSPIEISGPMTCSWAIPPGASRFRTRVLLPVSMQAWGNLQLLLSLDGRVVEKVHLSAANPTAMIDIPVAGRVFTLQLTEAANGPIQDTIVLEYPMFLLSP